MTFNKQSLGVRKNLGVRRHVAAFDPGDMSPSKQSGDMSPHSKESEVTA